MIDNIPMCAGVLAGIFFIFGVNSRISKDFDDGYYPNRTYHYKLYFAASLILITISLLCK